MDCCARLSTLEEHHRFLNSERPYHSETFVRGRFVVKSRFGDDSRTEWAARRQVRAEVGARVSYTANRRKNRMQIHKLITTTLSNRHCSSRPQRECTVPLPDGTNYVQQTVVNATAKQIQIETTNSGYSLVAQPAAERLYRSF